MSNDGEHEPLQIFRAVYKDETSGTFTPLTETVKIKPWSVSKSGEHIILWDDIKAAFGNPVHAMSKDSILPFLTDENSEALQPLRLSVHPGDVIDVVTEDPGIEIAMRSLRIQKPPASSPSSEIPAAANSSSPSTKLENIRQTQQPGKSRQDGGEPLENSTCTLQEPESSDQTHQLVSDYKDNSLCCCDEIEPVTGSQHRGDVSVFKGDERDANEDYVRGLAYCEGKNVPQDYVEALDLFLRAANRGHTLAEFKLRNIIENREAVEHDYSKAYERYLEAAKQGCADAQSNIGFLYQVGYGVTKDYSKAVEWYQKATEQGHLYAHCNLGFMYDRGFGIDQDCFKAVELYRISADAGCARAQNNLGLLYEDGSGVTQDYSKAME
ncbi:hypothetical protein BGX21_005643, partial [Mortierella sp. AD011]